jgi:hypothetical protein
MTQSVPTAPPASATPAAPPTTAGTSATGQLPLDAGTIRPFVEGLIAFMETGTPPEGLFRPDVFCDFTPPHWRLQARGPEGVVRLRLAGHPGPSRVARWRADPTPDGFVLEAEERWDDAGERWYCRELIRAGIAGGQIADLSVYCTGDWSQARQDEHARAVQLLRP